MNATFIIDSKVIDGIITINDCNDIDIKGMIKDLKTWGVNPKDIAIITK